MDEIIIEEKKYISSKQAAKITGYAKDYIGQLCREGRVPARLVGRNWYVLETAIQDHRFGDSEVESEEIVKKEVLPPVSVLPSTWEAPRYEMSSEEVLPSINRLQEEPSDSIHPQEKEEPSVSIADIQDSWRAWFDRFDHIEGAIKPETEPEKELEEEKAIDIPIHTISRVVPSELLPRHLEEIEPVINDWKQQKESLSHKNRGRTVIRTIQIGGVLLAMVSVIVAVIGTGYFDKYILSNNQVRIIAGVSLYNK